MNPDTGNGEPRHQARQETGKLGHQARQEAANPDHKQDRKQGDWAPSKTGHGEPTPQARQDTGNPGPKQDRKRGTKAPSKTTYARAVALAWAKRLSHLGYVGVRIPQIIFRCIVHRNRFSTFCGIPLHYN